MVERDIIVAGLPYGYEYEFISSVFEEYHCHICHLPLREPVLTRCGHRYCKKCLDEAIKRYDDLCNISKLAVSGNADEKIVKISSWKSVKSNQDWEVNFVIPAEIYKTKNRVLLDNRIILMIKLYWTESLNASFFFSLSVWLFYKIKNMLFSKCSWKRIFMSGS